MSAMERITGYDWAAWFRHIILAAFRGAAMGVKAAMTAATASVATSEMWQPTLIDMKLLGYAAIAGFLYEFCDAVIKNPAPTGQEVDETTLNRITS